MNDSTLNPSTNKIPLKVSEYIKNRFDDSFLSEIVEEDDNNGHHNYKVDISHDNFLYHLKFNSDGSIVEESNEPIWELFDYDEYGVGD